MVHQTTIEVSTHGHAFIDLTPRISRAVAESRIETGTCDLFVRHTSASLVVQENADPAVLRDLQRWLEWLAPESPPFGRWEHDDEGPDDMPAHARTVLTRTSERVPVTRGSLALGAWQAIYLWEHRRSARARQIVITVMGE